MKKLRRCKRKIKKINVGMILDWILTAVVTASCGVIELIVLCSGDWVIAISIVILGVCLLTLIKWFNFGKE